MLLACQQVPGVDGSALLTPEGTAEVRTAAGKAEASEVTPLERALIEGQERARRNERISMFMSLGSFCIGALGLWFSWKRFGSGSGQ